MKMIFAIYLCCMFSYGRKEINIEAVVSQAKTGSGNTLNYLMPGRSRIQKNSIEHVTIRGPGYIECLYHKKNLIVLKTHLFDTFVERYNEHRKEYDIKNCNIYMNLRNPVDQLASAFVQHFKKESFYCDPQTNCSHLNNENDNFDMDSVNLNLMFDDWAQNSNVLKELWVEPTKLVNNFTPKNMESFLYQELPAIYDPINKNMFGNCHLIVQRTEHLSDGSSKLGLKKIKPERFKHITSNSSRLQTFACNFIKHKKNNDLSVANLVFRFCEEWSDCC